MKTDSPASRRRAGRAAFTLIELTVVLLLMAIVVALAVPSYRDSISHHRVQATALRVKADLELAKQLAIDTGSPVTVAFDVASESYQTPPLAGLAAGVVAKTRVNLRDDPYRCEILTAVFGRNSWVTLDRFGLPQVAGAVKLQSGSHQRVVLINGQTGSVQILRVLADAIEEATVENSF